MGLAEIAIAAVVVVIVYEVGFCMGRRIRDDALDRLTSQVSERAAKVGGKAAIDVARANLPATVAVKTDSVRAMLDKMEENLRIEP